MHSYFKIIGNTDQISSWKSKGLFDEIIKPPATSDNILVPALSYKTRVKVKRRCLEQDKITFTPGTILNIYVVCFLF